VPKSTAARPLAPVPRESVGNKQKIQGSPGRPRGSCNGLHGPEDMEFITKSGRFSQSCGSPQIPIVHEKRLLRGTTPRVRCTRQCSRISSYFRTDCLWEKRIALDGESCSPFACLATLTWQVNGILEYLNVLRTNLQI